ncbi:TetR/AcrR family transcriptional regulator [Streptomyces sparsogenes]|uniref:TetR family transcriptional regulator n=1 Tax=Streptomyces sparsogenes DSM 40356 TaxID=1331668 RepID=A0A1R1SBJ5_9ACTN|nr:TetR/AcrR family transcriptional regulator [Streptomyces sparsogenes]OMI35686.1 TetR family transcriptional regulator [Streptomyces sparsogenes DSM 40356]
MTAHDPASRPAADRQGYHHGDLRRALLAAAVEAIEESGAAAVSLRDLARRAGVSHAAPAHHFGDKAGLLTAVAVEGFELLADALNATWERTDDVAEVGVAYVRFGLTHRGHFEVMFQPSLCHDDAADLVAARARAAESLYGGADVLTARAGNEDRQIAAWAAWSLVHGFTTLQLGGALALPPDADPDGVARQVVTFLAK